MVVHVYDNIINYILDNITERGVGPMENATAERNRITLVSHNVLKILKKISL